MLKIFEMFKKKDKIKIDPINDPDVYKNYTYEYAVNVIQGTDIINSFNITTVFLSKTQDVALQKAKRHAKELLENGVSMLEAGNDSYSFFPSRLINKIRLKKEPTKIAVYED